MTEALDVEVTPVANPQEAMADADIVIAATNSVNPVFVSIKHSGNWRDTTRGT
jgi:ornithine cyclodeaminase/alanine dehydrogenase-like protein (mu-crystallin family)